MFRTAWNFGDGRAELAIAVTLTADTQSERLGGEGNPTTGGSP
jgi:hypothetical protein